MATGSHTHAGTKSQKRWWILNFFGMVVVVVVCAAVRWGWVYMGQQFE